MIWLIGNKGMLGSDVELLLKENNLDYYGTDQDINITSISAIEQFIQGKSIRYIVNCSAYTNVDGAETEQEKAFAINADAVKNLVLAAEKIKAVLIHISTDYIFNGKADTPYKEEDLAEPLSVYGESKLKGEQEIISNLKKYFIIRTAWLYGKNGRNFVHTVLKLLQEKDELRIVNDQTGTPTYSKDLARIILLLIQKKSEQYGIYHYTNEGKTTWFKFAGRIYQLARRKGLINKEVKVMPIKTRDYPLPAQRPGYSVLSNDKITKVFGIDIRDWQDALEDFMKNEVR